MPDGTGNVQQVPPSAYASTSPASLPGVAPSAAVPASAVPQAAAPSASSAPSASPLSTTPPPGVGSPSPGASPHGAQPAASPPPGAYQPPYAGSSSRTTTAPSAAPGGSQPGVSLDKATPPSAPVPAATKTSKSPARRKEAGVETIAPSLRVAGKRRQSPLLLVVSLLLILGCAGIFGALYMNAGNRSDVLVAAQDIPLGHVIEASDLTRAEVAGSNFKYIPWTQRNGVIGTTAVVTIPKGGMLSSSQLANETTIPDGFVSVGLDLQPGQFPQELMPGRKVRIFDGAPESQGRTVVDAAQVVRIDREVSNSANALVSLALTESDAEKVAAMRETVVLSMHPLNK